MTTAPAAVLVEPVVRAAQVVRTTMLGLVVLLVIVVVSLQAFALLYGVGNRPFGGLPEAPVATLAAERIVAEQEAMGLTCRPEPALTDQVVFQYFAGSPGADVMTFEQAVAAQASGAGSIQRYCL